jgi:hypothetical protein
MIHVPTTDAPPSVLVVLAEIAILSSTTVRAVSYFTVPGRSIFSDLISAIPAVSLLIRLVVVQTISVVTISVLISSDAVEWSNSCSAKFILKAVCA